MESPKKKIQILYFARLREERGESEERIETSATTASELYQELQRQHGFSLEKNHLKVVINDEFQPWETDLQSNDTVTFIPPVAGG